MRIILLFALFGISNAFMPILPKKNLSIRKQTDLNLFSESAEIVNSLSTNTILTQLPFVKKSLTIGGICSSWILGNSLWLGMGFEAWLISLIYFVSGSLVTKIKFKEKEEAGIAEKRAGRRGPENVFGSGAIPLISSIAINFLPEYENQLKLILIASFATKLSDTFASEIGKAYGENCYLITNLKRVPKGTEGAVSIEGTLAGLLGAFLISISGYELGLISNVNEIIIINLSAFIATTIESYLGATLQDNKPWLTNEFINFINTLTGAIVSLILYSN